MTLNVLSSSGIGWQHDTKDTEFTQNVLQMHKVFLYLFYPQKLPKSRFLG